ncbi:hypothetical protein PRUPE_3G055600 [Prunus persica]|uniref:Malectin-like domain-containing protein n=1 Tax=Prunus persica TaxID=3760 RepID=A0A251PVT2_PRUPE|nr:hypothetical protein PRUPE_3G055600 [Prunus persica]
MCFYISGFISIDCGLQTDLGYSEKRTGINYIYDATFIDTGESKFTLPSHRDDYQQPYWSVRSFPEGARNCYKINVTRGNKYLIRASFLYGNYDGQDKIPEFELHLGPNLWDTVSLRTSEPNDKELIYVPLRNYIHVCLVNTGSGVPFISALELRPLPNASYQTKTGSLALVSRYDTGQRHNRTGYRYPLDILDRIWCAYNDLDNWTQLDTISTINSDSGDPYQLPSVVMRTASTPKNPCDSLSIIFSLPDKDAEYYGYLHFAEVEILKLNQSRLQYVFWDGAGTFGPFAPQYLSTNTIYSTNAWSTRGPYANISITRAKNSTLPPILNAFEIYMVKHFVEAETNQEDVDAITSIKSTYNIKRNWQGDPCAPQDYIWQGVKCNYQEFESPRIISFEVTKHTIRNLSSSGLTGEIAASISNLTMIQSLDLSNNNLTGPIPEFLSKFLNLTVLNLEKNKFTGSVPVGLIERKNSGFLSLSLCDNAHLSRHVSCILKKKHSFVIPIVSIAGIFILLVVAAICWWGFKRKRQHENIMVLRTESKTYCEHHSISSQVPTATFNFLDPKPQLTKSTKRQFTYSEILKMTNNFERVLGKGGFGTVYHGYMPCVMTLGHVRREAERGGEKETVRPHTKPNHYASTHDTYGGQNPKIKNNYYRSFNNGKRSRHSNTYRSGGNNPSKTNNRAPLLFEPNPEEEKRGVIFRHNDSLIIRVDISNFDVGRILVDTSSSVSVMFGEALNELQVPDHLLDQTVFWMGLRWKRQHEMMKNFKPNRLVECEGQHFAYSEIVKITNDFASTIGRGGFGKVYLGTLTHETQVAVKLLNSSSRQGSKEF